MRRALLPAACLAALLVSCGDGAPPDPDWTLLPADLRGGVAVYGDCRTGHDAHRRLAAGALSLDPEATFCAGDLVEDGDSPLQWETFNAIVGSLRAAAPFYPALGNHENASPLYFANFDLPGNERWYSVDAGGAHWVVLDTGSSLAPGSTQEAWLAADLAAPRAASIRHAVALFHHPPYSTGEHAEDEMGLRQTLVPLLVAAGVRLAFAGHDHDYERSFAAGATWVVTGGGGAPLRGQARSRPESVIFAPVHHFCVVHPGEAGALAVDVWDEGANLVDRFEVPPP